MTLGAEPWGRGDAEAAPAWLSDDGEFRQRDAVLGGLRQGVGIRERQGGEGEEGMPGRRCVAWRR